MWRIVHSPFGLHLAAIRENPRKAEYLGVRVRLFRLVAFLISAFYGAVGGAILAVNTGQADPELAYWTHSGELVFMTVLGGFANFFGPLVGAFTFIFLKSELMGATQYWRFFLGATLALIVVALPARADGPGGRRGLEEGGAAMSAADRDASACARPTATSSPSTASRSRSPTARWSSIVGPQRRRQDDARQRADRPAEADRRRACASRARTSPASAR